MRQLVLEGDPKLVARLEKELLEEFAAQGLAGQVTVEAQTVQAKVAPGEMGFGEEIRQILVGIADVMEAGKEAISKLSEGIAKRLAQNTLDMEILPDRTVRVHERSVRGGSHVPELADKISQILEAQQAC